MLLLYGVLRLSYCCWCLRAWFGLWDLVCFLFVVVMFGGLFFCLVGLFVWGYLCFFISLLFGLLAGYGVLGCFAISLCLLVCWIDCDFVFCIVVIITL